MVFYGKANIPVISERKACERMLQLLGDNAKIRAIPCKRRSTPTSLNKVRQMEKKLTETFPLWPANVEQLIKNSDDLKFLKSMKGDRSATFGAYDKVLAAKMQRRQIRDQSEVARRMKMHQEKATTTASVRTAATDFQSDSTSSNDEAGITTVASSTTPRRHRRTRTGTQTFIPHDIVQRPKLVALATRLKMTPAQQAASTEALIAEAEGEPAKLSTSYSTADRSRRQVGHTLASKCREDWVAPRFATLHWDSKRMSSLRYEAVNSLVAKSAIRAFRLHLWYLTAEMVPLALFSSKVPLEARRALADNILAFKPVTEVFEPQHRFGTGFGKPKFSDNISLSTTLANLVGPDSWFIFHALCLDPQFLSEDVENWQQSVAYLNSARNLQALNVIND